MKGSLNLHRPKKFCELQKEQLTSVQKTVQTEMKTLSNVVKKNCENNASSMKRMRKVVESAVQDDARS
jgi:hypothetical protein